MKPRNWREANESSAPKESDENVIVARNGRDINKKNTIGEAAQRNRFINNRIDSRNSVKTDPENGHHEQKGRSIPDPVMMTSSGRFLNGDWFVLGRRPIIRRLAVCFCRSKNLMGRESFHNDVIKRLAANERLGCDCFSANRYAIRERVGS